MRPQAAGSLGHERFRLSRPRCPAHRPAPRVRSGTRRWRRGGPRHGRSRGRYAPVMRERGAHTRSFHHARGPRVPRCPAGFPSVSAAYPRTLVAQCPHRSGPDRRGPPAPRRRRLRGPRAPDALGMAGRRATRPWLPLWIVPAQGRAPGFRRRHAWFHGVATACGRERSTAVDRYRLAGGGRRLRHRDHSLLACESSAQGLGRCRARPGARWATGIRIRTEARAGERVAGTGHEPPSTRAPLDVVG